MLLMFFILPEGEEEMNIQFFRMKLASGRYTTKAADYSHNVQSNCAASSCHVLWVLRGSVNKSNGISPEKKIHEWLIMQSHCSAFDLLFPK